MMSTSWRVPSVMTIAFPSGWVVQNQPTKVVAATPQKDAFLQMTAVPPPPGVKPPELLSKSLAGVRLTDGEAIAANGLQGSGWAVLGYDSLGDKLLTFQLYDQQANVPLGIIPLLQVDMWEHAFYLQYKNVKAD